MCTILYPHWSITEATVGKEALGLLNGDARSAAFPQCNLRLKAYVTKFPSDDRLVMFDLLYCSRKAQMLSNKASYVNLTWGIMERVSVETFDVVFITYIVTEGR